MRSPRPDEVTDREAQVLAALGEHQTNAQIARRLHISVRTVESHVSSLLRKYDVGDRRTLASLTDAGEASPARAADRFSRPAPPRTSFVGRERERDAAIAAVTHSRLVTLLGPGGVGKTRLAGVVADRLTATKQTGGAFVDLVAVREGYVVQAVAGALRVVERPPYPLEHAIQRHLRHGDALLVLDNCEHLTDEVSQFVELVLAGCPQTRILATSRERLGSADETVVHVPPLPLGSDAERLFAERARGIDTEFAPDEQTVSTLCARLDGMPLAIELAAARSVTLGIDGLATAIGDRLRLLTGGRAVDERHRSLSAVIDWSYDLLADEERTVFRRLGIFVGGFDLTSAAAVLPGYSPSTVADIIGRLADKSLVVRQARGGVSRWRMLETIRAYALDQLEADEETADEMRRHHLIWADGVAADLEARLADDWRADFDEVVDDLRAAAIGSPDPQPISYRLTRSLAHLLFARRFFLDARELYQLAATRAATAEDAVADLRNAASTATAVENGGTAFAILVEAADLARTAGATNACAAALGHAVLVADRFPAGFAAWVPAGQTQAMLAEAVAISDAADPQLVALLAAARAWNEASMKADPDPALVGPAMEAALHTGDPILIVAALDGLGTAAANAGRMREARGIAARRLRLASNLPRHEPQAAVEITDAFYTASTYAVFTGDLAAALDLARQARDADPVGNHPYIAPSRVLVALALSGRFDEASRQADLMWDGWRAAGSPIVSWMSRIASAAALTHGLLGDGRYELWRDRARTIAGPDATAYARYLRPFEAFVAARIAVHTYRLDRAAQQIDAAFGTFDRPWDEAFARVAGAELAVVSGAPDAAERLTAAMPAAAEDDWAAACLLRASGRLNRDSNALAAAVQAWEGVDASFERACTLMLMPDRADEGRAQLRALGCQMPASQPPVRA